MVILIALVAISLLVLVHELGHFLAAKKNGILVEEFGIGLPPRIWGKKIGETIYSINALPIGGYVRLYGEDVIESPAGDQATTQQMKALLNRAFFKQKRRVRFLVLTAGVLMNFVLGAVFFSVIYSVLGIPEESNKVIVVGLEEGSLMSEAGFKLEDEVKTINFGEGESQVDKVEALVKDIDENKGKTAELVIVRDGGDMKLELNIPESEPVKITAVAKDSPAEMAGFKTGDSVVAVSLGEEKTELSGKDEFVDFVTGHKGEELTFYIERDGESLEITATPRGNPPEGEGSLGVVVSNLDLSGIEKWQTSFRGSVASVAAFSPWGLAVTNIDLVKHPFWQMPFRGLWFGVKEALGWGLMILLGLYGMFRDLFVSGVVPTEVAGPAGIVGLIGTASKEGLLPLMHFVAILSVNLAILNILPLPALDGGRLVFLGVEAITGRRVNGKIEQWIHAVGMALLLGLMVLVTLNDFVRIAGAESIGDLFSRLWLF